jgi:long-subunit acyl-CoA synthetase (AMP-forming)
MNLIQNVPIGFWSGTVEAMLDDMSILQPISFFGVPRIFQKFQDALDDDRGK